MSNELQPQAAVIVTGNPVEGITLTGPFPTNEDAANYINSVADLLDSEWWIAPIINPHPEKSDSRTIPLPLIDGEFLEVGEVRAAKPKPREMRELLAIAAEALDQRGADYTEEIRHNRHMEYDEELFQKLESQAKRFRELFL